MIVHTSAIVFRSVDYQESSKIVTLFTKEHGKIAVIVRGAKKPKSKFSGLIEVGNLLDVVYYHKDSRSVQILSEASLLEKTLNIRTDFEKMSTAVSAIELIGQLLHDDEINQPLYEFTHNFLLWLDQSAQSSPQQIFPYVQIRLANLTGIGLQLELPGNSIPQSAFLNISSGSITPESTSSHAFKLTEKQLQYIYLALQDKGARIFDLSLSKGELKELIKHLDRYFKYHVEGLRDRKSDAIFEQMLQE